MAEPDGRVVVEITGDDSGLENSLNNASSAMRNTTSQITQSANSTAASVTSMSNAMNSVSSAASAAGSSASAASSAMSAAASGTETASDAAADYSGALAGLQASLDRVNANLGETNNSLAEISEGMNQTSENTDKSDSVLQKLGGTIKSVFTVALIKEFAEAVYGVGSAFEYSLSKVESIADTTAVSIGEISEEVLELSSRTGASAAEINEAVYQAISAGVDTADAVKTVETAVKSSKAGFTDTATAIDGLTTVINSFKSANLEADEVANKFLITQNLGKTSFGEIASAIGNVAPTANAAGVSIEELLSATASLTANGIATSQAMTGLKAAMSNIITPSSNAKKMAEELGIQFDASALKSKGLTGMMKEIAEATQGDTEKMAQLFGSVEALNTMLTLTSDGGAELFDKTMSEMATNTTALDDAFDTMTDNVSAKTDIMKTAAENFGIAIYDSISGGLGDSITVVTDYINRLHDALTEGGISQLGGELFQIAFDAVEELGSGIAEALPYLVPEALKTVITVANTIQDNIDTVVNTAENIITALGEALTSEETLNILTRDVPTILVRIASTLTTELAQRQLDFIQFGIDLCEKIADGLVHYDWKTAATDMMNNLADELEIAQKKVYLYLDDLFNGGNMYGGDIGNVVLPTEGYAGYLTYMRDGIDDTAEFIGEKSEEIAGYYDEFYTESDTAAKLNLEWQASVMQGYAENARNTAGVIADGNAEVADSAAEAAETVEESADTIEETTDKISEDFKNFYTKLETLKAHGEIDSDEFNRRLEEKLKSSAEYLAPVYNKYWEKLSKGNSKAEKAAQAKVSDDFKAYYDNQKLLLDMGEENGGISQKTFYSNLESKLKSISDSGTNSAYSPYWKQLKNYNEKEARETAQEKKKLTDQLKKDQEKADRELLNQQKKAAQRELSQLKSDISDLQSEYRKKLSDLTSERDKFKDKLSANIFSTSEETVTDKRTGQTVKKKTDTVADIKKKIEARKKLGKYLVDLVEKKGIPKGLLSELAGMDPEDALRFAEQLDKMDSDKWENIKSSYEEYEEINRKIADDIYGPEIKALNEQFENDMSGLLDGVTGEAARKGAEMITAFIAGVDTASDDAVDDIRKQADRIISEMNNAVTDSKLAGGKMELALGDVDGVDAGEDIAGQIADGIENNSAAISAAVEKAISEGMSDIKAAVDVKTSAIQQNVSASVPASADSGSGDSPVREIHTEKIIYRDVKLLWKDGRSLAEIVNNENKIIGIQGGET